MSLIMEICRGGLKQDPWDTAPRSEKFQQTRMSEAKQKTPAQLIRMSSFRLCGPLNLGRKQLF